jgi:hypothetical protein
VDTGGGGRGGLERGLRGVRLVGDEAERLELLVLHVHVLVMLV